MQFVELISVVVEQRTLFIVKYYQQAAQFMEFFVMRAELVLDLNLMARK